MEHTLSPTIQTPAHWDTHKPNFTLQSQPSTYTLMA